MSDGRWQGRDERLGAALRELEVPDHAPGFFARLDERLDAERRPARRARTGLAALGRRRAGLVAAAAAGVAAVLVLALGLPRTGPVPALGPARATAAEVRARVATALATVRTMTGEIVLRARDARTDALRTRRWSFAMTSRGDVRLRSTDGAENAAYDAARGVQRALQPSASLGGGPLFASELRGLAPGPPDPGPNDWVLQRELGSTVRALLADSDPRVVETTFGGRPAWRLDVRVVPNQIVADADHLVVTVDRETGIPVHVVARLRGRLQSDLRIQRLSLDAPLPAGTFQLAFPGGKEVFRQDAGFRRMGLDGVARVVGYRPLVPARVPDGYRLAEVAVARRGGPTGAEGANPLSEMVVSLSYRRGLDRFIVTTRLSRPASLPDDLASWAPSRLWGDPLAAGEGIPERARPAILRTGALAGARARLVIGPRSLPHLWALTDRLVVTVGGDLSRAEILAVAGSLAPLR